MITYTNNRQKEYNKYINKCNAWLISLEYSEKLYKLKDKNNIKENIYNIYAEYIQKLKSNNINIQSNYKYINIWNTLMNTLNNPKNNLKKIRASIHQLNYINHINN
jgi:hypothetical protein